MDIYEELKPFFNPKAVAVIGASREKGTVGWSIFRNFLESKKFRGKAYPVNPKAKEILNRKCFSKVGDITGDIDMAVIATPAKIVPKVLRECADKGIPGAIIVSSGFSEIGHKHIEAEIQHISLEKNIRVIGPNCLGVFDGHTGVDTLFLPEEKLQRPKAGNIALISQSGAVGSIILDWISSEGYGISKFVSYGNGADLDESDFIEYLAEDDKTDVICLYLEGSKNGRRMYHMIKDAVKEKPVLIIKAGSSKEGTRAVSSHTGSLAGADEVYQAAFKQAGAFRTHDMEKMFDYAQALSHQPLPKGGNILVVTNGGGFGVLATDEIISRGLKLAKLGDKSKRTIKRILPSYAGIHNPLDLIGDADSKRYDKVLRTIAKDKNIDAIMIITLFQTVSLDPRIVSVLKSFNKYCKKPKVVCASGGDYSNRMMEEIEATGIPVYNTPAKAADGLYALVKYSQIKRGIF
jgi:acetyl coenzyme A synthetase (ADP forming)-like protein